MNSNLTLDGLIAKIREEIDEIDLSRLAPDTEIRKIEGWTSLHGLIIMALVSTEYGLELSASQIQATHTVEDLYRTLKEKMA